MRFQLATKLRPDREALEVAGQAGFRAVEFWTNADLLSHPHSIASLAEKFDLNYVIHFPNRAELTSQQLRHAAELYTALGCRAMVMHRPMWDRYGAELLGCDPSLRLGVENHCLSLATFEEWASHHSWLTLDVEHLWKFTLQDGPLSVLLETLENFLSRFAEKLVHVHLPGYLPGSRNTGPCIAAGIWCWGCCRCWRTISSMASSSARSTRNTKTRMIWKWMCSWENALSNFAGKKPQPVPTKPPANIRNDLGVFDDDRTDFV